jgi:aminoglycoside 6'-N-acetyltransferase
MSIAQATSFLQETAGATRLSPGQWIQLAIAEIDTDLLVGDLGLYMAPDCSFAEVGFTLARAHQGQGHATRAVQLALAEVFRLDTVSEVRAVTDRVNVGSVAVLDRAGFSLLISQETTFKGKPCVELLYAMRRSEA